MFLFWFFIIISLVLSIIGISLTTRRLHDIGKSGWWQLLVFIPLGVVVLLVFLLMPSQNKENRKKINEERMEKKELIELGNNSKKKLDSYVEQLRFKIIKPEHIVDIANLTYTFFYYNHLLNSQIKGSFEEAKDMLDKTQPEQEKVINNLKKYLTNKMLGFNWRIEDLIDIKEYCLNFMHKEMNEIFREK